MGKDYLGADQRKVAGDDKKDDKPIQALDEGDIALLKTYGTLYVWGLFELIAYCIESLRASDISNLVSHCLSRMQTRFDA